MRLIAALIAGFACGYFFGLWSGAWLAKRWLAEQLRLAKEAALSPHPTTQPTKQTTK